MARVLVLAGSRAQGRSGTGRHEPSRNQRSTNRSLTMHRSIHSHQKSPHPLYFAVGDTWSVATLRTGPPHGGRTDVPTDGSGDRAAGAQPAGTTEAFRPCPVQSDASATRGVSKGIPYVGAGRRAAADGRGRPRTEGGEPARCGIRLGAGVARTGSGRPGGLPSGGGHPHPPAGRSYSPALERRELLTPVAGHGRRDRRARPEAWAPRGARGRARDRCNVSSRESRRQAPCPPAATGSRFLRRV
jgi:hypothetical protein